MPAKLKLHRCSWTFLHTDLDACWKVQRALDEQGIEYEVVKHGFGKGKKMATSGVGAAVLGGWKISQLWSFYSGTPFSVTSSATSLALPNSSQRATPQNAPIAHMRR